MRTPPLLLGAALLFWGWQTGFLVAGAVMALMLEGARLIKWRWDFSDDDFSRIWTVCTVLFLGTVGYAFTDNGGPARFGTLLQNTSLSTLNSAGTASARTASAILRWLPMVLFLFVAAQACSTRLEIPLTTISLILRRRWKRAARSGAPVTPPYAMNVSYPYFAVCLFAASIHGSDDDTYFMGLCALVGWALWTRRARRFGVAVWITALGLAFAGGYFGQHGISQLQSYIQNLDTQWILRFLHGRTLNSQQNRTAIGSIGDLKASGRIVIRLEPKDGSPPPTYLREASYRIFTSPNNWKVSNVKEEFDQVQYGTTNTTWLLLPAKTNTAKVGIACYLEGRTREPETPAGLLPLPTGCGRLEHLPVFTLKKNGAGAVLAEGPGLVVFDALYGPGATADAPPGFTLRTNEDLMVPPAERPALDQVIAEFQPATGNTEQTLRAVNAFFQSKFSYSTWLKSDSELAAGEAGSRVVSSRRLAPPSETPLGRFLVRTRSGHCEYFATATVLLLRQLGIPTRYAVGYVVHESSRNGYVVRLRDAHAWCLVWNRETGSWQDFDTTPASWVAEEAKQRSPFQKLADAWSWIKFQISKFRWGQTNLQRFLLMALVPVLALLLAQLFFRLKRHRRRQAQAAGSRTFWPGLDSEFYLVEKKLLERGLARRPGEPLSDWLARLMKADTALGRANGSLLELLQLHYRYRFDPRGLTAADREELRRRATACLAAVAH